MERLLTRGMRTATDIGERLLKRLAAQAAANHAAGEALRAEVRSVLERHPGEHLTARQAIALLSRTSPPSIRRVQEILKGIRAESSASR